METYCTLAGRRLWVEFTHYEPDEGQPVDYIDIEQCEDMAGNPVTLSPMEEKAITLFVERQIPDLNRRASQEWSRQRRVQATVSSPSQKLTVLPRA
jgi:hypothetical protein